jgi:hypothetical protein
MTSAPTTVVASSRSPSSSTLATTPTMGVMKESTLNRAAPRRAMSRLARTTATMELSTAR